MEFDALSKRVIGLAIDVHRELGPGLLESTYEACLAHELNSAGIPCVTQIPLPVLYKELKLDCGYRVDLLVDDALIIELKSSRALEPIHEAQLLTYLRLAGLNTGLLINFNVRVLRDGIKRLIA